MFTQTLVQNPNYKGQRGVVATVVRVACRCGSVSVAKAYVTDASGEVTGQRLTCRTCGASESF